MARCKSFTSRSLVGMTQGARKRRAREWMEWERLHQRAQDLQEVVDRQMGRRSQPRTVGHTPGRLKQYYRIGQKLRPCAGCIRCECQTAFDVWPKLGEALAKDLPTCDGSGVLPARKKTK